MEEKKDLNLIHDNDLVEFLSNIGILKSIKDGERKCKFCKEIITLNTINAVFPEEKSIKVVCNEPACVVEFSNYINEKNLV